ncbi:MAG: OmpA family protein [Elusimicrobia bacterium]|nr:OmpA family protein [Elusimicrobiota bacterium]
MKRFILALLALILGACAGGKLRERDSLITQLKAEAAQMDSQIKSRDERLAALESEKQDLAGKITELNSRIEASQGQIKRLEQSNNDLSQSIAASKGELANKVKELVAGKDELSRKLAETQKEIAGLKSVKDKLTRDNAALRERNKIIEGKLAAVQAEREQEQAKRQELQAMIKTQAQAVSGVCSKEIEAGLVKVEEQSAGFTVTIQEALLFEFQQAKFIKNAPLFLDQLAEALLETGWKIRIEAHSDNTVLKRELRELFMGFTSHWDLTAARASGLARYLIEQAKLDPKLISAAAFGDSRPVASNDTDEGRAANRRIVLAVELP